MAKNKDKKTAELARAPAAQLAIPDYVKQGNEGLENMRPTDIVFPRVLIMQGLSPGVQEKTYEPGMLVNSVSGEVLAPSGEARCFVPIKHWVSWILWGDREAGEGLQEFSMDPKSELAKRASAGEKDADGNFMITEYHNFLALFIDSGRSVSALSDLVCFCCARTNYKHGRRLLNLARLRGQVPLYAGAYTVKAKMETNRRGQKYYVTEFVPAGWAPQAVYELAEQFYNALKQIQFSADVKEDDVTESVEENSEI